MFKSLKNIGPGAMVAAAFIGPGTVTTATIAGSSFGYTLLWAVLFSVLATLVLQEMAARLGVTSQNGLGHALRTKAKHPLVKLLVSILVIVAVLIGNAAYEAGNISGAVLGLQYPTGVWPFNPWIILIGACAFFLLWLGKYRWIERSLVTLVAIMGLVFLISAIALKPDLLKILNGLFVVRLPEGALIMVVSLIGTTVVPYNLFLHASSVKSRWSEDQLPAARLDTAVSVIGGGIITMAILITAAVAFQGTQSEINGINDLALQLNPILGEWSTSFLSLGFLAAGLSSAITAPLAASFATSEVLGLNANLKAPSFRLIWGLVLLIGLVFSGLGFKPTMVILFAQFANGILLPMVAIFLLWIMNDPKIVGHHVNSMKTNIVGGIVILVAVLLGLKSIITVLT